MILFSPKSRYFKSNIPDIIFKIECFRQKIIHLKLILYYFIVPKTPENELFFGGRLGATSFFEKDVVADTTTARCI
jgi:hypothetical protein